MLLRILEILIWVVLCGSKKEHISKEHVYYNNQYVQYFEYSYNQLGRIKEITGYHWDDDSGKFVLFTDIDVPLLCSFFCPDKIYGKVGSSLPRAGKYYFDQSSYVIYEYAFDEKNNPGTQTVEYVLNENTDIEIRKTKTKIFTYDEADSGCLLTQTTITDDGIQEIIYEYF